MILHFCMVSIAWHPVYDHVFKKKKNGCLPALPLQKNHYSQLTRTPKFFTFQKKKIMIFNQSGPPFCKINRVIPSNKKIMFLNRLDFPFLSSDQQNKKKKEQQKEWHLINRASLSTRPSFKKRGERGGAKQRVWSLINQASLFRKQPGFPFFKKNLKKKSRSIGLPPF